MLTAERRSGNQIFAHGQSADDDRIETNLSDEARRDINSAIDEMLFPARLTTCPTKKCKTNPLAITPVRDCCHSLHAMSRQERPSSRTVVVSMILYWRRKEQELAAAAKRDIPGPLQAEQSGEAER
jgi:hypothetical protein